MSYFLNRLSRFFGFALYSRYRDDSSEPFFIVFNPTWPDPPRKRFATLDEALLIAEMLAKKQPADVFFVLKTVSVVRPSTSVHEFPSGDK